MKKVFITLFLHLFCMSLFSQTMQERELTFVFKFRARNDMFYARGNEMELKRLHSFVKQYKSEIVSEQVFIRVNGYCTSHNLARKNSQLAFIRSNRVKSELIVVDKLKEKHFITKNQVESYEGKDDVVVLSFYFSPPSSTLEDTQSVQPASILQSESKKTQIGQKSDEQLKEFQLIAFSHSPSSYYANLFYWDLTIPNFQIGDLNVNIFYFCTMRHVALVGHIIKKTYLCTQNLLCGRAFNFSSDRASPIWVENKSLFGVVAIG